MYFYRSDSVPFKKIHFEGRQELRLPMKLLQKTSDKGTKLCNNTIAEIMLTTGSRAFQKGTEGLCR